MAYHDLPPIRPFRLASPRLFLPSRLSLTLLLLLLLGTLSGLVAPVDAALVRFENCLSPAVINNRPQRLQFVPYVVDARFNSTDSINRLNITVYGNVTGRFFEAPLPPPGDPDWDDPKQQNGKIVDLDPSTNILTTLFTDIRVLDYVAWKPGGIRFCENTVNNACPLKPSFGVDKNDTSKLSGFSVANSFFSTYSMTTLRARLSVQSGLGSKDHAPYLACVLAEITPVLTAPLRSAITYVPVAILILAAISTVIALRLSPWSSADLYRWTSNYERDEDIIRLATPGFMDCLQYIQFVTLMGALSLDYPGYFQPAVSNLGWSIMLFNRSLASKKPAFVSSQDDIYTVDAPHGLSRFRQYVGIAEDHDVWAGIAVWLAVLIAVVVALSQIAVLARWLYLQARNEAEVDRQNRGLPFTIGNVFRIVFNYFYLPFVALTMFQFVVAPRSPAVITVMAALLLVVLLGLSVWVLRVVIGRPRVELLDSLPMLLQYGPIYNSYADSTSTFAIIIMIVNFIRGVAFGAVQSSGVAQLVLLAVMEVFLLLSIYAFKPYEPSTSMNGHSVLLSVIRFVVIMLSISFVPELDSSATVRGWVGYTILLLHSLVLVFCFFRNSLQTTIEVFARMGSAGNNRGRFTIGYGRRDLAKRQHRVGHNHQGSATAMLPGKPAVLTHNRNTSRTSDPTAPNSIGVASADLSTVTEAPSTGATTPGGTQIQYAPIPNGFSSITSNPYVSPTISPPSNARHSHPNTFDSYYRPPRFKTQTDRGRHSLDIHPQGKFSRASGGVRTESHSPDMDNISEHGSEPVEVSRVSKKTNYAVRESDFYHGVRLEPETPAPQPRWASAAAERPSGFAGASTWLKGVWGMLPFGPKPKKEKGFHVVRGPPPADMVQPYQPTGKEKDESTMLNKETGGVSGQRPPSQDGSTGSTSPSSPTSPTAAEPLGVSTRREGSSSYQPISQVQNSAEPSPTTLQPPQKSLLAVAKDSIGRPAAVVPVIPARSSKRTSFGDHNLPQVSFNDSSPRSLSRSETNGDGDSHVSSFSSSRNLYSSRPAAPASPGITRESTGLPFLRTRTPSDAFRPESSLSQTESFHSIPDTSSESDDGVRIPSRLSAPYGDAVSERAVGVGLQQQGRPTWFDARARDPHDGVDVGTSSTTAMGIPDLDGSGLGWPATWELPFATQRRPLSVGSVVSGSSIRLSHPPQEMIRESVGQKAEIFDSENDPDVFLNGAGDSR